MSWEAQESWEQAGSELEQAGSERGEQARSEWELGELEQAGSELE